MFIILKTSCSSTFLQKQHKDIDHGMIKNWFSIDSVNKWKVYESMEIHNYVPSLLDGCFIISVSFEAASGRKMRADGIWSSNIWYLFWWEREPSRSQTEGRQITKGTRGCEKNWTAAAYIGEKKKTQSCQSEILIDSLVEWYPAAVSDFLHAFPMRGRTRHNSF